MYQLLFLILCYVVISRMKYLLLPFDLKKNKKNLIISLDSMQLFIYSILFSDYNDNNRK